MIEKIIKIVKDFAELRLNPKIYSKETIFATGYVFLDKAHILLDQDKDKILVYEALGRIL